VDQADAGSCAPLELSVRVTAGSDDAEERMSSGGSINLTSSDLELTEDGTRLQVVGLRFRNLDVPREALILGARVQFTADETDSVATSLTIEGEASDDATTFVEVDGDVTSRPRTSHAIAWEPPPWTSPGAAGPDQRTPELAAVVQEIVDRPGWSAGNALALLISGSGHRTASAYDGSAGQAAILEVSYLEACEADADGDGFTCKVDCNDGDASVHPGVVDLCDGVDNDCDGDVDEDYLPTPTSCGVGSCDASGALECVAGEIIDSCEAGTPAADDALCNGLDEDCDGSVDEDFVPQATSCGVGACGASGDTACVAGTVVDSCDPGAPAASDATCDGVDDDCDGSVDEEFGSQSCATGQPGICAAGTTSCQAGTELCEADLQPQAEICTDGLDNDCDGDADLEDAANCTAVPVSVQVDRNEDDAEESTSTENVSLSSSDLELTEDGSKVQVVGMRFRNVDLPQGATILGARIQFTAADPDSTATHLTIEGEDADDADAFSRSKRDVTSRTRTSESVDWDPPAWTSSGASGSAQRSPELTAVVQEIVDRPGWSNGNAMVLLISGSGQRVAESYDGSADEAAVLELEYLSTTP
jgi:hypothetical protein